MVPVFRPILKSRSSPPLTWPLAATLHWQGRFSSSQENRYHPKGFSASTGLDLCEPQRFRSPGSLKGAILRCSFSFSFLISSRSQRAAGVIDPNFDVGQQDVGCERPRYSSNAAMQYFICFALRNMLVHLPGATTKMPLPFTGTKMCPFLALTATE